MNPFEIEKMALEPFLPITIKLPVSLLAAVDAQSKRELQNRSAWMRAAVLALLNQRQEKAKKIAA